MKIQWKKFEKFGCGLGMDGDILMHVPMLVNGDLESNEDIICEVENFEGDGFAGQITNGPHGGRHPN